MSVPVWAGVQKSSKEQVPVVRVVLCCFELRRFNFVLIPTEKPTEI